MCLFYFFYAQTFVSASDIDVYMWVDVVGFIFFSKFEEILLQDFASRIEFRKQLSCQSK